MGRKTSGKAARRSSALGGESVAEAKRLGKQLEDVSEGLGERPTGRSEPDAIVDWRDVLAVVEAKLTSKNDSKPAGYVGWSLVRFARSRGCVS